jgi:hypothetical protein
MEEAEKITKKEEVEGKDGETIKKEETLNKDETENKPVDPPKPEEENKNEEKQPDKVEETEPKGNGIPLDMVALKTDVEAMIKEAILPFQSKLDSVLKENADLKEQLAQSKTETENVRKKYEDNGDFGTSQKKGAGFSDGKSGNSTYVSYEEMWNGATSFEKN